MKTVLKNYFIDFIYKRAKHKTIRANLVPVMAQSKQIRMLVFSDWMGQEGADDHRGPLAFDSKLHQKELPSAIVFRWWWKKINFHRSRWGLTTCLAPRFDGQTITEAFSWCGFQLHSPSVESGWAGLALVGRPTLRSPLQEHCRNRISWPLIKICKFLLDCFISLKPYVSVRVLQKKQNYVSIICPSIHPPIYLAIHLSICVYRHTYIYSLKVIGKARNSGRNWCYSLLQETLLLTYKAFNCLDKAHHVIKGNLLYSKWTDCRG